MDYFVCAICGTAVYGKLYTAVPERAPSENRVFYMEQRIMDGRSPRKLLFVNRQEERRETCLCPSCIGSLKLGKSDEV